MTDLDYGLSCMPLYSWWKSPKGIAQHLKLQCTYIELRILTPSTRFKIEDARYAKDNLAAWACIRLDRLHQGYRFVYLLDAKGQATAGLLLVKIEKRTSDWK